MPSYLLGKFTSGAGAGGASGDGCCCTDNTLDRNSAVFFNNLATKLLDMSKAIQKRMDELANRVPPPPQAGFLFAKIDTPVMTLGVKMEYVEYIKRYGPPIKGKFDETKLNDLRAELGISVTDTVI